MLAQPHSNKKSLQRGWAPLEAHYTLQPTRDKAHGLRIRLGPAPLRIQNLGDLSIESGTDLTFSS